MDSGLGDEKQGTMTGMMPDPNVIRCYIPPHDGKYWIVMVTDGGRSNMRQFLCLTRHISSTFVVSKSTKCIPQCERFSLFRGARLLLFPLGRGSLWINTLYSDREYCSLSHMSVLCPRPLRMLALGKHFLMTDEPFQLLSQRNIFPP